MRISGRLDRRLDLASGRFALIAGSRSFTLVPWRDDMARHFGRELDARIGNSGISWSIGGAGADPRSAETGWQEPYERPGVSAR